MRQRLVRHRMQRLPQQLPAFLQLVCGHEMQAGVVRVLLVVLGELRVELAVKRVGFPGFARRTRLRELGQPQVQTLMRRVGADQPVQRRGAGAHQAGDEDRPFDGDVGVLRVLLPRRLRQQSGHQRAAQEEAIHLAAQHRKARVLTVRVQQNLQCFEVVVVVGAEVVQPGQLAGRCLQFIDGGNICPVGAFSHYCAAFSSSLRSASSPARISCGTPRSSRPGSGR